MPAKRFCEFRSWAVPDRVCRVDLAARSLEPRVWHCDRRAIDIEPRPFRPTQLPCENRCACWSSELSTRRCRAGKSPFCPFLCPNILRLHPKMPRAHLACAAPMPGSIAGSISFSVCVCMCSSLCGYALCIYLTRHHGFLCVCVSSLSRMLFASRRSGLLVLQPHAITTRNRKVAIPLRLRSRLPTPPVFFQQCGAAVSAQVSKSIATSKS